MKVATYCIVMVCLLCSTALAQGDPVETQARLAFIQGNYLEGIVRSIEALFTGSEGANSL